MCDVTHPYKWHDSHTCATWFIHVYNMGHSYMWHDPHTCATWLTHMTRLVHDMTYPCDLRTMPELAQALNILVAQYEDKIPLLLSWVRIGEALATKLPRITTQIFHTTQPPRMFVCRGRVRPSILVLFFEHIPIVMTSVFLGLVFWTILDTIFFRSCSKATRLFLLWSNKHCITQLWAKSAHYHSWLLWCSGWEKQMWYGNKIIDLMKRPSWLSGVENWETQIPNDGVFWKIAGKSESRSLRATTWPWKWHDAPRRQSTMRNWSSSAFVTDAFKMVENTTLSSGIQDTAYTCIYLYACIYL